MPEREVIVLRVTSGGARCKGVFARLPWLPLVCAAACHHVGEVKPVPVSVQASSRCKGDAPLPRSLAALPGARASWVPDPADGALLYVLTVGRASSAPPLVIFHGIGDNGVEDFFPALPVLGRARQVIALDLPGFGRSSYHSDDLGPDRLIRAMEAALRACDADARAVDVLGHSSGALLALLFAGKHSDWVRHVVMAAPIGILRPEVLLPAQLATQLTDMHDDHPVAARAFLTLADIAVQLTRALTPSSQALADSGLIGRRPGVLVATSLLDYNFGEPLAKVHTPTLVLVGKRDRVAPPRVARVLEGTLPEVRLEYVAGAGHVIMEDRPDQFAASVERFLRQPWIKPHPPEHEAEGRIAVCRKQSNMVIRGRYEEVVLDDCHHAWLDRVSAGRVTVYRSEARLDQLEVREGFTAQDSRLIFTAGTLRGRTALALDNSQIDMAGTTLEGSEFAIVSRGKNRLALSVTTLRSPNTDRVVHRLFELHDGDVR